MVKNILLACVLTAAGGYLLGSILFGVLISKVMYNDDVRNHGSGNAGMTNVLRTYGKLPAVFTTIGDVGKSVAAVNLGRFIFDALLSGTGAAWQNPLDPVCGAYLAAIFCMIGHSRPIFFGFKGGKGILCSGTLLLLLDWRIALVGWGAFVVLWLTTRYVSLGSVAAAVSLPFTTYFVFHNTACTVLGTCISLLVLWAHRSNIKRLLSGTESKFHFHVNAPKPGEDE